MGVVVIGGSIAGLATALALARQGVDVHVLEGDPVALEPRDAPLTARRGVVQHAHAHSVLSRSHNLLRERAPDVIEAALDAGVWEYRFPASLGVDDPRLVPLASRRPVFEAVIRSVVRREARVTIETGVHVDGLVVDRGRVTGVRTADGRSIAADFVVDGGGRISKLADWVAAAGAAPPTADVQPSAIAGYAVHFALRPGESYPTGHWYLGPTADGGGVRAVVFHGDNDTFTVLLVVTAGDAPMAVVREREAFLRVARAIPMLEPWMAVSDPVSDVQSMPRIRNVRHHWMRDGGPALAGVQPIGDALCHTNPQFGWGMSFAITHGFAIADAYAAADGDPLATAHEFDARVGSEMQAYYEASAAMDRDLLRMNAGEPVDVLDPASGMWLWAVAVPAGLHDPVVARAVVGYLHLVDPHDALRSNEEVLARITGLLPQLAPPAPQPGRQALLDLLAAAPA